MRLTMHLRVIVRSLSRVYKGSLLSQKLSIYIHGLKVQESRRNTEHVLRLVRKSFAIYRMSSASLPAYQTACFPM
jgi:hypothetical protein